MKRGFIIRFVSLLFLVGLFTVDLYSQNTHKDFKGKITLKSYAGEWKWVNENKTETLIFYLRDTIWVWDGNEDFLARSKEEEEELKRLSKAYRLPGWSIPNNVTLTKVISK